MQPLCGSSVRHTDKMRINPRFPSPSPPSPAPPLSATLTYLPNTKCPLACCCTVPVSSDIPHRNHTSGITSPLPPKLLGISLNLGSPSTML
eukprot:4066635-Prymnesium_polylepis.1